MRKRKRVKRRKWSQRQRYAIQRPSPEGDGVEWWSTVGTWFTGNPAEDYGHYELAVFDGEPSAAEVTGFANSVAVPLQQED
jgi:hypothetical protein